MHSFLRRVKCGICCLCLLSKRVLVLLQLGEHARALRLLALVLCDIRLAEAYCARYAGAEGHAQLLEMLLRPGDGREPLYADACHLLAAQGAHPSCTIQPCPPLCLTTAASCRMTTTLYHYGCRHACAPVHSYYSGMQQAWHPPFVCCILHHYL